jgi:hypothetical protein
MYYLSLARAAYERVYDPADFDPLAPTLDEWRRAECRYATEGKSLSDGLSNDEFSAAIANFKSWRDCGRRASHAEIRREANRKRVEALRPLWEAVITAVRIDVIHDRFKIRLLEEAETFSAYELNQLRWTLMRLAKQHPKQQEPVTT